MNGIFLAVDDNAPAVVRFAPVHLDPLLVLSDQDIFLQALQLTLEARNDQGEGRGQASGGTSLLKVSLLHAARVHQRGLSSHQKNQLSVWAWVSIMGAGFGVWVSYGLVLRVCWPSPESRSNPKFKADAVRRCMFPAVCSARRLTQR